MNYDKLMSERAASLKPSGIRKFFDIVEERKDAISLGVGQPHFVTPEHVREVGIESLREGNTKYTSNAGTLELRYEIDRFLTRKYGVSYSAKDEILVTVGGSEACDLAIRAIADPGDEVIVPEPSFTCYVPLTVMAGAKPVVIPTRREDEFRLTPELLKAAITPRTKLLVLPFPSNPTGGVMDKSDLEAVADILRGTDIFVLSDEIYSELVYGMKHTCFASIPGMRERTILVNGFSKTYAMTGWRLGYACAPMPILSQMYKIHQFAIMCAPTTSQYAAIDALKNGDGDIAYMNAEYDKRRRFVVEGFNALGLDCFEPRGAFYAFPSVKSTGLSSDEFCERLLMEENVACVPGEAFGECGRGHIRCCYASSMENLEEAMLRIGRFVGRIKNA